MGARTILTVVEADVVPAEGDPTRAVEAAQGTDVGQPAGLVPAVVTQENVEGATTRIVAKGRTVALRVGIVVNVDHGVKALGTTDLRLERKALLQMVTKEMTIKGTMDARIAGAVNHTMMETMIVQTDPVHVQAQKTEGTFKNSYTVS